ncbi:MAG TPA: hypothetical protein VLE95_09025, partial [Chlamydiales bacterium]|nr:hypothetical protein [Chlamydiales bacterium]
MRLDKVQQNYWLSRTAASFSSAVKWTAEEVGCALSKTATAWERTPKVLKLPLAAAFLDFQRLKNWKNVAAGAFLMTEVPKVTAAFFCNYPIQWFGNRFQLFSVSLPDDPKTSLTDLDIKIGMFERAQPHLAASFAQTKPIKKPPILPQTPLAVMEKNTNRNLEVLSGKIAYLSILQVLHAYSGLPESDSPSLLNLVDDASRMSKPSLWRLFISHYGSKISWWGRLKAAVFYAFTWSWIPIIPKTVDAYLKTMLKELRANLKEDVEKRNKFINGLLEDADTFFEIYNGAVETYANDGARKGKLSHYQNNAVQLMFVKDGSDLRTQSPASFRMDLSRKISASIVDHFGPKVSFGFGFLDRLLNYLIKFTLREKILPQVFLNITNEGKEAAKSNIPFSIALTKTLITQISKLQGDLQQGDSDTSSLAGIGIKGFEPIVKKFLWSLDIAECKTVEEIRLKIEQLKRPENDINAEVRKKIQMGIQTGLAAIFDYLSKQENTEELFATFFDSVSAPLSGHVPITEKQWIEMATEYEGTKILLKQAGSSLCKQIVQTAVQDAVRGGSNPAAIQKSAQKILSEHKFRGMEVFEELCQIGKTIEKKINQSKDFVGTENDILKELEAMTSILKAFENTERVKITLDQDPPPKIAALPNAEREAILRVLYPLYEGSNKTM